MAQKVEQQIGSPENPYQTQGVQSRRQAIGSAASGSTVTADGRVIPPPGTTPAATPAAQTDPFAFDPYGDIAAYEGFQFDYPLQMMQARKMQAQTFDPQRQRALGAVYGGAESGFLGGASQLASTSGLSATDREALRRQAARQKASLGQGATAAIDQMQAQNLYDTSQFNTQQSQQAEDYNQKLLNDKAREMALQRERHALTMYQRRVQEAILQRQLEKAAEIAAQQK